MSDCHCGHDYWEHFLEEIRDMAIITGKCHDEDCNCTEFHHEDECDLPTHSRSDQ